MIGNIVIDVLKMIVKEIYEYEVLMKLGDDCFILLMVYWCENLGELMKNMFCVVKCIVDEYEDV